MWHKESKAARAEAGVAKVTRDEAQAVRTYAAPQVVFVGRARDLLQGSGTARLDFGNYGWMRRY
jgi:hypothetical protein